MPVESYKDLIVWQKSMDLVVEIYKISDIFPKSELYGLTSQMRRCAVSIPSNIAEGKRRSSRKDFNHFLTISFGSGSELETQIEIVKRLPFGKDLDFTKIDSLLLETMKMLNKLIATLQATN
jgi:four helix bundle protein